MHYYQDQLQHQNVLNNFRLLGSYIQLHWI